MSRANQWFVLGDGIAREVITADIQRYLGPDALVRPGPGTGENEGRHGYWITAYRTLTSQMIQDLKMDSQRWQQEQGRQEAGRGVAYQDSRTHAARQHWGPSQAAQAQAQVQEAYDPPRQAARPQQYAAPTHSQQYATDNHYTTTPAATYNASAYAAPSSAQPRTAPDYSGYSQPVREHQGYTTQQYPYPQHTTQDPYRQSAQAPPQHVYAAAPSPVVAAPGYYIASDGRQYPLPTQPQPRRGNP